MLDLLATATAFTVIVAVLVLALAGLTVVPFVVSVTMAERRDFHPGRWGAIALAATGAGLVAAYLLWEHTGVPRPIAVLPVALTWAAPGVLWLLDGTEQVVGGRPGRHE